MTLEIVWSPLALARLQEIRALVALDKPEAAELLAMRIVAVVETLRNNPRAGRAGFEANIRELLIAGTPYIVLYSIRGSRIVITNIWHGAQRK